MNKKRGRCVSRLGDTPVFKHALNSNTSFYIHFMLRYIFIVLGVFIGTSLSAQLQLNVEAGMGSSFRNDVEIQGRECDNDPAFIAYTQLNTQFNVYHKLYTQLGLGLRYTNITGEYEHTSFKSDVFRVEFSALLAYPLAKRFDIASGVVLTTHRDFEHIELHRSDNLRWDFIAKPIFQLNEKLRLLMAYKVLLNDKGGEYLVGAPKHSVLIGAQYLIKAK